MASHGAAAGGNKFTSVNLNKSFGQSLSYNTYYRNHNGGSASRVRSAGPGGDGMVVLSRPRTSQKVAPKLSVPPPLNLPSIRKEHEKFDLNGPGGGLGAASGTATGARPNLSAAGWTKPNAVALLDKDGTADALVPDCADQTVLVGKGSGSYMPPSARTSGLGLPSGHPYVRPAEKAMVLRGEDFPSLQAALPTTSGPSHKQRDNLNQKHKQDFSDKTSNEQKDYNDMHSPLPMRPRGQYNNSTPSNGSTATGGQGTRSGDSFSMVNQTQMQEDYPLPLVRLNPRSDWADDERDTGHMTADKGRDDGLNRSEHYWDRDFGISRTSVLPQNPPNITYGNHGLNDFGKGLSSEVRKVDPYHRDGKNSTQEGNNWRTTPLQNVGYNMHAVSAGVNLSNQPVGLGRDISRDNERENKYVPPRVGVSAHDNAFTGIGESAPGRKDKMHWQDGRLHWNNMVESTIQRPEQKDKFAAGQSVRYMGNIPQHKTISKSSLSSGSKGLAVNDSVLNFSRQKLHMSKNDRPYAEDPLLKDLGSTGFDENEPFPGGIVGVIKRKKEVINQDYMHDPVRESFEAELERVQKMQEMERKRIMEEQERILEQARREEEERQRMIRDDEERRRRLEEEAKEAVWRAEQERLEVIRRAEEQKIAREEEKRRISLEEERRKHAAKEKLLELEARMSKQHSETENSQSSFAAVKNEKVSSVMKEKDMTGDTYMDDWEDSERMVERITTSASSDTSSCNRPFVTSSRLPPLVKSSSGFLERGKTVNAWRKNVFENVNSSSLAVQHQDNAHLSLRRDASVGEGARKKPYGRAGFPNAYFKGGMQVTYSGEYTCIKEDRWNLYKDGDPQNKNKGIGSESYANVSEIYDDASWGQAHTGGNTYSAYGEQLYPNIDADELYSYGRSRFSMKQPRVLPPPLIKSSFRGENEYPGPSSSLGVDTPCSYNSRSESALPTRYDDESNESGDSPAITASAEQKVIPLSENDSHVLQKSREDTIMTTSSSITVGEDEEWILNENEKKQEQEEYDEDGYQEEDEVHEVDDENIDPTSEFENLHLEEKDSSDMIDNLVLGFDEGVEVRLPNDEFDSNINGDEYHCEIPEVSIGTLEDQGSSDGKQYDAEKVQPVDCSPQTDTTFASGRIGSTERTTQGTVVQPINNPPTSVVCDQLNTYNSELSSLSTASSSVYTASHVSCTQSITSVASSVPNSADLPVKLQFGLFSGPSLIPSPVPSIQIGSIEMPLHLHLPLDPSITHVHTSQRPLFQFGQLSYTTPISQGILPMYPQSSLMHPTIKRHYNVHQNSGGSMPNKSDQQKHTRNVMNDKVSTFPVNSKLAVALKISDENRPGVLGSGPEGGIADMSIALHKSGIEVPQAVNSGHILNSVTRAQDNMPFDSPIKNVGQSYVKRPQWQLQPTENFVSSEKVNVSKTEVPSNGNKGKKLPHVARNYCGRSFSSQESFYSESRKSQRRPRNSVQRTEFRVRQSSSKFSSKNLGSDDKLSSNGTGVEFPTRRYKKNTTSLGSLDQVDDPEVLNWGPISSQETDSDRKVTKDKAKDELLKSRGIQFTRKGSMNKNISEEDVDTPSQSGIVHVFKQSGIEAPSDEDDFIEVRSKRQMLNDRREQREKEIKAKSQVTKLPRKSRSSAQSTTVSISSTGNYASISGYTSNNIQTGSTSEDQGKDVSVGFSSMASQQLAPIGTPALVTDSPADIRPHTKSLQGAAVPVVSDGGKENRRGLMYDNKVKVLDTIKTASVAWVDARTSQQVMTLTQNQLEEAMNPARFETHVPSSEGQSTKEVMLASSSSLAKDKSLSSLASPVNSLLAGEKIQFGAVTSPTVLPPSTNCVPSLQIESSGSFLSNIKMSQNISRVRNDSPVLLEKDKCVPESCGQSANCEDDAKTSASADAIISSDKISVNQLCSLSISDATNSGPTGIHGIVEGVSDDQQSRIQSRVEESLSVSLPADLSVEATPLSSWPPLPSPQNSSSQVLSHFPVAPPSHFPFYEMNPVLGGPVFTFSPIEESVGSQSQSQNKPVSGQHPVGTWQQCHPTLDSFYGPPAGYNGPFINPPGGLPGVEAPSQMLVYNHYARVGQFGQVGLSFMGTTYIPSGKQPDWKHNPTSSGMGIGDGDISSMNMMSAQHHSPDIPAPLPHLALGPPILPMPMATPMAMFDVSPFQSAPDMSVQGRWSPSPPLTLPLQQQPEDVSASQFSHGHPIEQLGANRFPETQTPAPSDSNHTFSVVAAAKHPHSSGEFEIVDTSANVITHQNSGETAMADTGKIEAVQNGSTSTSSSHSMNSLKQQRSQQKTLSSQQYNNPTGYNYQRGRASQKNNSGGEWSHHRMGFQGRNHSPAAEKMLPNSRVRQIYVPKLTKGSSTAD